MSDLERLKDKLGKLGQKASGMSLDTSSEAALLTGLALLVDETILPRRIAIAAGKKSVELTVTKRRLISVSGAVTASFDEEYSPETLQRLGAELAAALKGADVEISSERAEIPPELHGAGPGVAAIATAWGADLYASGQSTAPDGGVVDFLRSKAYAWVTWEGETETDHAGDADYLRVLKKNLSRKGLRAQHGGTKGMVALGGNGFATVIGLAWDGTSETAFVVARVDLASLARAAG